MGKYRPISRSVIATFIKQLFYWGLLALLSSYATANPCPKVNCDCANLPIESWRTSCQLHEQNLIQHCVQNNGQPTDFCFLHGPSGFPLPLSTQLKPAPSISEDKIAAEKQRATISYWTIHHDINNVISKIDNDEFAQAQSVLTTLGSKFDQLFAKQRQITNSMETAEAFAAWRVFSQDTYDEAAKLYEVATHLWDIRQFEDHTQRDKAYRIFSIKILRLASQSFEIAAFSFANAGQHKKAAKVWKSASGASKSLLEYKQILGAPRKHLSYYRKQTAARLLRASYHWQMYENSNISRDISRASRETLKESDATTGLLHQRSTAITSASMTAITEH